MFGGIVAIFIIIGIGLYTTRGLRRGNGPSRFEEIMGQIEAADPETAPKNRLRAARREET